MPSLNIVDKNYRDVLYRNVTVALLALLNDRIKVYQVESGTEAEYKIPFFYHFAGDENFMKDFFIPNEHGCVSVNKAEGNFEMNPKGIVKLQSMSIKQNEITNKFVRGTLKRTEYNESDQKIINAFSAYLFALPINLSFEVKVYADSMNQILQIVQSIVEEFYKNNMIYFNFRGNRLPAQFEFSDQYAYEKTIPFTYEDNNKISSTIDIKAETFHPIYDEETMLSRAHRIMQFKLSVNDEEFTVDKNYVPNPPGPNSPPIYQVP